MYIDGLTFFRFEPLLPILSNKVPLSILLQISLTGIWLDEISPEVTVRIWPHGAFSRLKTGPYGSERYRSSMKWAVEWRRGEKVGMVSNSFGSLVTKAAEDWGEPREGGVGWSYTSCSLKCFPLLDILKSEVLWHIFVVILREGVIMHYMR